MALGQRRSETKVITGTGKFPRRGSSLFPILAGKIDFETQNIQPAYGGSGERIIAAQGVE